MTGKNEEMHMIIIVAVIALVAWWWSQNMMYKARPVRRTYAPAPAPKHMMHYEETPMAQPPMAHSQYLQRPAPGPAPKSHYEEAPMMKSPVKMAPYMKKMRR